ncbi:MAG: hypothetical protein ABWY37_00130 [Microbacterium pygmaeum]
MGSDIDRRSFLRGGLLVTTTAALGVLVGCAPSDAPPADSAPSSPSPTSTPSGAASADAATGASARPTLSPSFGPNGTHFPDSTPWPGESAASDLVVDCSWEAIGAAVEGLTAAQVAAGAVIRVSPGTLSGNGAKSSSNPVLAGLGDPAWERNVLICPADGFGSVTVASEGIRLDACSRLSLFGFLSAGSFTLTECASMQLGWSRLDALNVTRGGTDLEMHELVLGFRYNPEDTVGIRPTDANAMTGISRYGCVFGPSVKPADSDAHCDTMQLEGTGTGEFGPFLNVDCVDYGSSNAAMLLHTQVIRAEFRHCMVLGDTLPWEVFPLRPGDYEGTPNAFSGGCEDVRAYDSVIAGPIGGMGFTDVQNTILSYTPQDKQQPSGSGSWTVDTSVASWDRDDIMSRQSVEDYETATLAALWTW